MRFHLLSSTAIVLLFSISGAVAQVENTDKATGEVTSGASVAATAGNGDGGALFGFRSTGLHDTVSLLFNFGDSGLQAKKKNLANSLIQPVIGNAGGVNFYISGRPLGRGKSPGGSIAPFLRFSNSRMEFLSEDEKTNVTGQLMTTTVGFEIALNRKLPEEESKPKPVVGLAAGYTWRRVNGEINDSDTDATTLRTAIFGSGNRIRKFDGLDFTLYANMGDVQPFVQFTQFNGTRGLQGFSNPRMVFGVRTIVDFFKAPKSEEPVPEEEDAKVSAVAAKKQGASAEKKVNPIGGLNSGDDYIQYSAGDVQDGKILLIADPYAKNGERDANNPDSVPSFPVRVTAIGNTLARSTSWDFNSLKWINVREGLKAFKKIRIRKGDEVFTIQREQPDERGSTPRRGLGF
ncbi:MAG: hypothetical protein QM758_15890 [Armatimonas sp.]